MLWRKKWFFFFPMNDFLCTITLHAFCKFWTTKTLVWKIWKDLKVPFTDIRLECKTETIGNRSWKIWVVWVNNTRFYSYSYRTKSTTGKKFKNTYSKLIRAYVCKKIIYSPNNWYICCIVAYNFVCINYALHWPE